MDKKIRRGSKQATGYKAIDLAIEKLNGEISPKEFNRRLVDMMLVGTFNKMEYKLLPVPPKEIIEYLKLKEEVRLRVSSEFFEQESVAEYMSIKARLREENKKSLAWLKTLLDLIPTDDLMNKHKVKKKVKDFEFKIQNGK